MLDMDGSRVFRRELVGVGVGSYYVIFVGVGCWVWEEWVCREGTVRHFILHEPMEQWDNGILDAASGLVWSALG